MSKLRFPQDIYLVTRQDDWGLRMPGQDVFSRKQLGVLIDPTARVVHRKIVLRGLLCKVHQSKRRHRRLN